MAKLGDKITLIAHCEMSQKRQARQRAALRKILRECPDWKTSKQDADVICEQMWNTLIDLEYEPFKPRR